MPLKNDKSRSSFVGKSAQQKSIEFLEIFAYNALLTTRTLTKLTWCKKHGETV